MVVNHGTSNTMQDFQKDRCVKYPLESTSSSLLNRSRTGCDFSQEFADDGHVSFVEFERVAPQLELYLLGSGDLCELIRFHVYVQPFHCQAVYVAIPVSNFCGLGERNLYAQILVILAVKSILPILRLATHGKINDCTHLPSLSVCHCVQCLLGRTSIAGLFRQRKNTQVHFVDGLIKFLAFIDALESQLDELFR